MTHTDLHGLLGDPAGLARTTTLIRENGLRTLLLHLKAGEHIPEHQTRGAITVQCLQGEATFSSGEEHVELRQAALIGVPPAQAHSVTAQQDTVLLITIWEQIQTKPA